MLFNKGSTQVITTLIMQWFWYKATTTTAKDKSTSYPMSFPTNCLCLVSCVQDSASNNNETTAKGYWVNMMAARVTSYSKYGIIIARSDSSTRQMWLAIGY